MLTPEQSKLAKLTTDLPKLDKIEYLDLNNIDAEGCSHLGKAHWPNLLQIDLSKILLSLGENNIGSAGLPYFCKYQWPKLIKMYLCKRFII